MLDFKGSVWITYLIIAFAVCMFVLPGLASASSDTSLNTTQLEGNSIQLSYTIDAYPRQTASIELETDLVHYGNVTLWTIDNAEQFNIPDADQALNEQKLLLNLPEGFTSPVQVTVSGKVPTITKVEQCDGVVLSKRPEKTTGFIFYRFTTLDTNGVVVGTALTQTFDIDIPSEDAFRNRLRGVSDDQLRNIIQAVHDEGLAKEADNLLTYAEQRPAQVSLIYPIALSIILVIIVGLGAYAIGFRKGKGRRGEDETDEERED
jgi:hypothetical protein